MGAAPPHRCSHFVNYVLVLFASPASPWLGWTAVPAPAHACLPVPCFTAVRFVNTRFILFHHNSFCLCLVDLCWGVLLLPTPPFFFFVRPFSRFCFSRCPSPATPQLT
eukprot:NODE_5973_length_477_cov_56.210280_g4498_i0.p2 GENE.NODE_5973_length_477_cov_56.210280_g4498_i0~~NODE_5973_length_477_cov_56.210280_g4498_i0.p2  ORF type:complete len:117 (-),score=15.22 NODE_5973_length_477_cov_56.210280_g4498_i0:126-449(-)